MKKEGEIITEMLEIVAKRDSLIALLEEERQRWRKPSCPTLTVFKSVNARTRPRLHRFNSPALPSSYVYVMIAIIVAYLISLHFAEFLFAWQKDNFSFFS